MDNFIKKIKNKLKPKKTFSKKEVNPYKHWRIILSSFFFLVICLIVFSLYILYQIKHDKIFQTEVSNRLKQELLDEQLFEKVQKNFENKAIKMKEIKDTSDLNL